MIPDEIGAELWLVARYDVHGAGVLVRDGLDRESAQALCDEYDRKNHHQTYTAISYAQDRLAEVLRREGLAR